MADRKASVMRVLGCSLPLVAHMQLLTRKSTSPVVEQSFSMQDVHIHRMIFELCMTKEKETKITKSNFSCLLFQFLYGQQNSWGIFPIEQQRSLSVSVLFHFAVVITELFVRILNLTIPYVENTTFLIYMYVAVDLYECTYICMYEWPAKLYYCLW